MAPNDYRSMIKKVSCSKCGTSNKLVVHHKDHDHSRNVIENLEVLCKSCHSRYHFLCYWEVIRNKGIVKKRKLQFAFDEDVEMMIIVEAAVTHRTRSEVVRQAVIRYCQEQARVRVRETAVQHGE